MIAIYGEKINFYSTSDMRGFSYWFLPIITSITGITFWYIVMDYFARKIQRSKAITFIAQNTFTIMETHLLFANFLNIIFFICKKVGIEYFKKFNEKSFLQNAWSGAAWNMNSRGQAARQAGAAYHAVHGPQRQHPRPGRGAQCRQGEEGERGGLIGLVLPTVYPFNILI